MGKPNMYLGGAQGYNLNMVFPKVSAGAGTGFQTVSACATDLAAVYPEVVTGNVCLVTNTASVTALCYYDGTIWTKN